LDGALKEIHQRTGKYPARYVLFTNLDVTHLTKGQKGALTKRIRKGTRRTVRVEIVGAAELAAFLNSAPHLRSAFFATAQFSTWQAAWEGLLQTKLFGAGVDLVGRETELSRVRSFVDDPQVRAIALTGPHNIGKSRLALQACDHRCLETVVALDPRSTTIADVLALVSPRTETVVVIEDPDLDLAEELVEHALITRNLKIVITLPTLETAPAPSFGRDSRVQTLSLGALPETKAEELLRSAGAHFDYGLESWVVSQAGGNPGILLFAASLGADLRRTATTFAEDVGKAFRQRTARVLGDTAIIDLELLSVLTHVGVSGQAAVELQVICDLLGEGRIPHTLLGALPRFIDAGVLRQGGQYVEVIPPFLANQLAGTALRGRFAQLCSLFGTLGQAGRLRLIRRVRQVKTEEVGAFWAALFGDDGLLHDLPTAIKHGRLLRLVAGTVPERVGALIHGQLIGTDLRSRQAIEGEARRSLMWALEELLFRDNTSRAALESIALLAEAETETYGTNATGVFAECFHPLHPQMPLHLADRADVLRSLLTEDQSPRRRIIAIRAIETALGYLPAVMLRQSEGLEPLGVRPSMTYGQIWDYIEDLAELLLTTVQAHETEVATAAAVRLPQVLAEATVKARPESGMARLKTAVDWAIAGQFSMRIADVSEALVHVRDELNRRRSGAEKEVRARLEPLVGEADALIRRMDEADYPIRFKRWIAKWGIGDHEDDVDEQGQHIYRGDKEIRKLAVEAIEQPVKLTDGLVVWLCTRDAQKAHMFAWWLGKLDQRRFWCERVERCGTSDEGAGVFASYFGGIAQHDRAFASQRLDELEASGTVTGAAIVGATGHLGGDGAGVARTVRLLSTARVDPDATARILSSGGWTASVTQEEYLNLVRAIAGQGLDHAMAVIDFFGMWLYQGKQIQGDLADFAWRCLEMLPRGSRNEHYDSDRLAAYLTRDDPERGFRLLERALAQPYDRENWNPLRQYGDRKFWSALLEHDRGRAISLVLRQALKGALERFTITWEFREIVDQVHDAETLIAFAGQSKRAAELVAESVTAARPGFWTVAFRLIEANPKDERVLGRLASAAEHLGHVIAGPLSAHYEHCRKEVEARLMDQSTPSAVRPWLRRLEAGLKAQVERELLSEVEQDVNDVRQIVDAPDAPERGWAAATLLRHGKVREALAIANRRELLRHLSRLKISKREKAELRRSLDELSGPQKGRAG
jgi:hypothetical protein